MKRITASIVTAEAFAPFGRVVDLTGRVNSQVTETLGATWSDHYTDAPIVREVPSLGRTVSSVAGQPVELMERHTEVEEAIVPSEADLVLTVAPPTLESQPSAKHIQSFVIPRGTVVVMNPGVWHAECAGLTEKVPYFWLASTVESGTTAWTQILDGPVCLTVEPQTTKRGSPHAA